MSGPAFSDTECRVLEHAADILRVPFAQLISIRNALPEFDNSFFLDTELPGVQLHARTESAGDFSTASYLPNTNFLQRIYDYATPIAGTILQSGNMAVNGLNYQSRASAPELAEALRTIVPSVRPLQVEHSGSLQTLPLPTLPVTLHTPSNIDQLNGTHSPSVGLNDSNSLIHQRKPDVESSNRGFDFGIVFPDPSEFGPTLQSSLVTCKLSESVSRHLLAAVDRVQIPASPTHSLVGSLGPKSRQQDHFTSKVRKIQPKQQSRGQISPLRTNHAMQPRSRVRHNDSDSRIRGRRGPFTPERRRQTHNTRKIGACIRCYMQHSICRPDPFDKLGPCQGCYTVSGRAVPWFPCLRYRISDAQLLDKGHHPRFKWTRRWTSMEMVEIEEWASLEIKTITLTQDIGNASYDIKVRQFVPIEGDSLERSWNSSSGPRSHPCAPYAMASMKETASTISQFVDQNIQNFISHYVDKKEKLLHKTYMAAYRHAYSSPNLDERELLQSILRLWVASRMESKQERISNGEVLGMAPLDSDPKEGESGRYLVPPVMQAQVEISTTTAILFPMKNAILKHMKSMIEKTLIRSWYTLYLANFILLHSCALLTRAEAVRADREGKFGSKSKYYNYELVEEFHNGAKIMLAFFHFCNKGSYPFAMNWDNASTASFAELNKEQVDFVKETVDLVKEKAQLFEEIKQSAKYDHDYYFVSQLYEINWQPSHTV